MAWTAADLTAIEDAIRAKIAGNAVQEYRIGDRFARYIPLSELYDIRDKMKADVDAAAGNGNIALVRFGRPV